MSLVEVVVALAILAIMVVGLYRGFRLGSDLTYSAAQRVAAFNLCRDRLEQLRAMPFNDLAVTNFEPEVMRLTHLGGSAGVPVMCERICSLNLTSTPLRVEADVRVEWDFMNRRLNESAQGIIYAGDL